jgi:protein tyrosine phosphatase (PTP) superfamily phosphohydrolase (DUF442 family)
MQFDEAELAAVTNSYKIDECLATSGQPTAAQLQAIAAAGYEMVINLALPTSDNAVADEGAIVTALGLTYIHIPVRWDAPRPADVLLFCAVMQAARGKKIWVHCVMNMRVSCFLFLYRKHVLKMPETQACHPMRLLWQPEGVWAELITETEPLLAQRYA